jgi:hypothetical protein
MAIEWTEASRDVIATAEEIIRQYHADLRNANIGFLFRSEAQSSGDKQVTATASKVSDKLRPFLDYDFIIWVAEDVWKSLTHERRQALIDHELCHCQYIGGPGEGKATILHHDIEEFIVIIERYGLWSHDLLNARNALSKAVQPTLFDSSTITMESEGKVVTLTGEQLSKVASMMG